METNKIDYFNIHAEALFKPELEQYGYVLNRIQINELNGIKWSTHHVYLNHDANLEIIIKQEPYYTDYGFSFFINRIGADEDRLLYNIPHEKQDNDGQFLLKAFDDIFSDPRIISIISGKNG